MKIGRILFLVSALALSQMGMAQKLATKSKVSAAKTAVPTLDVDKQLEYCHKQVTRALGELRQKDGGYDFTMEPRNILKGDSRKVGIVARLQPKSGAMAFGQASSGWTIRTPRMRLYARQPKAIRSR